MDSPMKEEKIEIKRGVLEKSPGKEKLLFKKWKQRYFVFCHVRRGTASWLKMYYYRSYASYKEGNVPLGFIDITTASHIGMVEREIDGRYHIINITTPGRDFFLSSSSCVERAHWLLALRSYKFYDVSRLPDALQRSYTWNGYYTSKLRTTSLTEGTRTPTSSEQRRISDSVLEPYEGANRSSRKLMNQFLLCRRCQRREVPTEVMEWVRPEISGIFSDSLGNTPNKRQSDGDDTIYEEIRLEDSFTNANLPTESEEYDRPYGNVRKALPLPFENIPREDSISSSETQSWHSGGTLFKVKIEKSRKEVDPSQESNDGECTPKRTKDVTILPKSLNNNTDEYVSMAKKDVADETNFSDYKRSNSLSKTTSVPYNLNTVRSRDEYIAFSGSTESLPASYEMMPTVDRYTKDPTVNGTKSTLDDPEKKQPICTEYIDMNANLPPVPRPTSRQDESTARMVDKNTQEPTVNGTKSTLDEPEKKQPICTEYIDMDANLPPVPRPTSRQDESTARMVDKNTQEPTVNGTKSTLDDPEKKQPICTEYSTMDANLPPVPSPTSRQDESTARMVESRTVQRSFKRRYGTEELMFITDV